MKFRKSFLITPQRIKIAFYNSNGNGKPVIFCHFTGGLGQLWIPVIQYLTASYNCFAYDARGHGNSSKPKICSSYSWDIHLNDLILVLTKIKEITQVSEIYGVGHSFGGALLSQAVLLTKHIVRWKKIILIEPILAPQNIDIKKEAMSSIAKKRRGYFETIDLLRKTLRNKYPYKNWSVEAWQIYEKYGFVKNKYGQMKIKCTPDIESYQYLHANPPGWFENLRKINIPVLLIYGKESELLPLAEFQIAQLEKAGYLLKLPNVHHFLPQEDPILTSQWILRWFGE